MYFLKHIVVIQFTFDENWFCNNNILLLVFAFVL